MKTKYNEDEFWRDKLTPEEFEDFEKVELKVLDT